MGCDIWLYAEVKYGDMWYPAVSKRHDLYGANAPNNTNYVRYEYEDLGDVFNWPNARCCVVFAALADVRNSGDITPVSLPRGLPANMNPLFRAYGESDIYFGDHSRSWLTLGELRAYDWSVLEDDGYVFDGSWMDENMEELGAYRADDHRFVFGFDS